MSVLDSEAPRKEKSACGIVFCFVIEKHDTLLGKSRFRIGLQGTHQKSIMYRLML